ncbi:MAG: hypothetical protein ABFD63_01220 [Smithella sp.]
MLVKCKGCPIKFEEKGNKKFHSPKCKKNYENSLRSAPKDKTRKVAKSTTKPPSELHSGSTPICPDRLNETAAGYWHKISPTVIERGHLNVLSEDAFAELCDLFSRLCDINKAIDETNRSLLQIDDKWDAKNGMETQSFKESALSDIKRKYSKLFLDYQKQFYLIPLSNRGNFGLEDKEEVDPHDAFLGMSGK